MWKSRETPKEGRELSVKVRGYKEKLQALVARSEVQENYKVLED